MTPEEIKEVRKTLDLTQEDLAVILGVTKTSVARYEMQNGSKPQGDVERKLAQLYAFTSDLDQRKQIKKMRLDAGGVAAIAGILAIGSATFPVAAAAVGGITLRAILTSPAALFLGGILGVAGGVVTAMTATTQSSTTRKDKKENSDV